MSTIADLQQEFYATQLGLSQPWPSINDLKYAYFLGVKNGNIVAGAASDAYFANLINTTSSTKTALSVTYAAKAAGRGFTSGRYIFGRTCGLTIAGGGVTTAVSGYGSSLAPLADHLYGVGMVATTIPAGVPPMWYQVDAQVRLEGGAAGERDIGVKVNGVSTLSKYFYATGTFIPSVSGSVLLNPGDALTVEVYSAPAVNIVARSGEKQDVSLTVRSLESLPVQPCIVGLSGDVPAGMPKKIEGTWMARSSWSDVATGPTSADFITWVATHPTESGDIGLPLIPHDLDPTRADWNTLLDEVTAGTHDASFTTLGGNLATKGPDTVYARLWWEMNQYYTDVNATKFKAAWAQAVPLIRAGFVAAARSGQVLKIVYCYMASGTNKMDYYPASEALVDVIAADVYAGQWTTAVPSLVSLLASVRVELDYLSLQGAIHGKPVALGEWANWTATNTGTGTYGRGDCVEVVNLVMDWVEQTAASYVVYFNIADGGVRQDLADTPLSLARLVERYASLVV